MMRCSLLQVMLPALVLGCVSAQEPPPLRRAAIADSIRVRMDALSAAISERDLASVLGFREDSALVSVAGGSIAASPAAAAEATGDFYRTLRQAVFRWDTIQVDVLDRDVALVAATWTFVATDTGGAPLSVAGAETYVWRRQGEGTWRIRQQHESYRP